MGACIKAQPASVYCPPRVSHPFAGWYVRHRLVHCQEPTLVKYRARSDRCLWHGQRGGGVRGYRAVQGEGVYWLG